MTDANHDDGFSEEAFKGLEDSSTPTPTPPASAEPPKEDPKPAEEPKKDEQPPADPEKKEEDAAPTGDAAKPQEDPKPAEDSKETPETPPAPEEPKPLTKDDLQSVINDIRTEERTSGQALETATNDVIEAYYPKGLSNVLVDQNTGKELRTPDDVVAATNGEMSTEEAAKWLMNEQYKLDQEVAKIKSDAKTIAETTLKFKQDGVAVLQRYEPLFKAYPQLQQKIWNQYEKLVKADKEKGVILSAPDMQEFYDTVLEPYQMAYEHANGQPATNPNPPANPQAPAAPATPSAEDRLDEGGDGGATPPDDPNDFAQQVKKELAKGI